MNNKLIEHLFVGTAKGEDLDFIGLDFGVQRNVGESDESYRTRIMPIWEQHRQYIIGESNGIDRKN